MIKAQKLAAISDLSSPLFRIMAIQSEACPIQLEIKGSRTGNYQFVNAIATPLANVMDRLDKFL
ncbi:MAG: hypothetical protein PHY99_03760 [Bacteroidales bacterium]|nr:hypothetical protein [Bacteroidales bacterium]